MRHKPTEEQQAIIDQALSSNENLLINALAGAAKTTTLEMLCHALPVQPILSIAFNKRIAVEMEKRMPGHVKCSTINALGHRTWSEAIGRRLVVDTKKLNNIWKEILAELNKTERYHMSDLYPETMKIVQQARIQGYVPEGKYPDAKRLINAETFFGGLEEEPSPLQIRVVNAMLVKSINAAYGGLIDFDDQIYMPTLFGGNFPKFGRTMADEAQDFSPINHELLRKLVGNRWLGAVGDPWQSIYSFRGAMNNSMKALGEHFNMKEMNLSISFRCPRAVVENAHWRVPHMRYPEWAVEGSLKTYEDWDATTIPDGSAIICRNNAPLFKCALQLIKQGRGVKLLGAEIGPGLVRILRKLGPESMTTAQVMAAIDAWEQDASRKSRNPGALVDKREALEVFALQSKDLAGAIVYAEHIFSCEGPIQLMSGHKSKGLEFDTVFHLDGWRVPSKWALKGTEEYEQELNVKYVIETRAKQHLGFIDMQTSKLGNGEDRND